MITFWLWKLNSQSLYTNIFLGIVQKYYLKILIAYSHLEFCRHHLQVLIFNMGAPWGSYRGNSPSPCLTKKNLHHEFFFKKQTPFFQFCFSSLGTSRSPSTAQHLITTINHYPTQLDQLTGCIPASDLIYYYYNSEVFT